MLFRAQTRTVQPDHAGLIAIACLVMAHKFPIDLSITYLPAILRDNGIALTQLWVLSIPLIPFWFRWAWAPVIDHNGSTRIGHRKSWILPCTLLATLLYGSIGIVEPIPANILALVAMFTLASLVMATQEVASDAYMVENIKPEDRHTGSAYIELGRSAAAIGIAVGLMTIYDKLGWAFTMPVAAALFFLLTLPVLIRKEPARPQELAQKFDEGETANLAWLIKKPALFFSLFLKPFRDFLGRRESGLLIGLIIFMGANLKLVQTTMAVFLVDLGLSFTQIGVLIGLGAAGGSILGALLAAWMLRRYSTVKNTAICMVLMIAAFTPWTILAFTKIDSIPFIFFSLAALGMLATPTQVLIIAARFRWASRAQAGTDFTLQASAEYVGYAIGAAIAGPLAAWLGWGPFFALALMLSLAGLTIFMRTHPFIEACIKTRPT